MRKSILYLSVVLFALLGSVIYAAPTQWTGKVGGVNALAISGGSGLMTASQIQQLLTSDSDVNSIGNTAISGSSLVLTNIMIQNVNIAQVVVTPSQQTSSAYMLVSDLQSAFLKKNPDIQSVTVNIVGNNLVNVQGKVKVGFVTLNLNLTGQMYIQNGSMYYTCTQAQMNGLGVPKKVVNAILNRTNPFFKFGCIDIPTYFNTITYGSDRIFLSTVNN